MSKSHPKIQREFNCTYCDYHTCKTSSWKKHIATKKHLMFVNTNVVEKSPFQCKTCGKAYSHASGLSRHKKRCKGKLSIKQRKQAILQANTKLYDKMETLLEETKILKSELKNIQSSTTTINNSHLNINLFLNQNCKDAMNLTDFIDNLKYTLEDLDYSGKNGYVKGVSNILIKNLTDIDPRERPLHCSDAKRLKFYIKDNDTWEKDEGNIKMSKSIDDISEKQRLKLKEWQEQNPDYEGDGTKSEEFFNIVRSIMGGGDDIELTKNKNKIIKSLSNDVSIKSVIDE